HDARPIAERDGEQRLLDRLGPLDLPAELAVRGVGDDDRLAQLGAAARDPHAAWGAEQGEREGLRRGRQLAEEGDRDELVAVGDEDTAVVVVDERPELS